MKAAMCRQSEEVLLQSDAEPQGVLIAWMQQHLPSCPSCRRHQRTWALVRESALAANDVLDDLTGARVFGRVQARLAEHAATEGGLQRRSGPMRTRLAASLAFAAVAILAFVLGTRLRKPEPGLAVAPVALEPYALHVPTQLDAAVSGKGLDHVELPPYAAMRARLGRAADLTLLGPLDITLRDSDKQRVELELGRGTLLAGFDGSGGRRLRISTPNATVDIVGTRFIVDASATRTRIAVDHGLVRVESLGRLRTVGSGLSWSTDEDALAPIDGRTARLFERAVQGRWEELASVPPPRNERSEASGERGTKENETTGRGKGVNRNQGAERTPHQRRVHVHGTSSTFEVDAEEADQTASRANPARRRSNVGSRAAGERLALAATPPLPSRSTSPIPTAPVQGAAP